MDGQGRNVVSSFIIYSTTVPGITTRVLLLYRRTTSSSTVYIVQCNVWVFKYKVRVILVCWSDVECVDKRFQGVSGYEAKLGGSREERDSSRLTINK
jgi:hypothetical protein